jgi:hypothetical protein
LKDKKPGPDRPGFLIYRCSTEVSRKKSELRFDPSPQAGGFSSATLLRIAFVKRRGID